MPKHRPIYFKEPGFSTDAKEKLDLFMKKHPIAASASKALLAMAILGGTLTLLAVAPGLTKIVGRKKYSWNNSDRYRRLWRRFNEFKKNNIFEFKGESKDGGLIYQFTENGKLIAKKFLLETLEIGLPKKWDGKWHIVVFDIPEKYKKARHALYSQLKNLRFYQLQKSVWVHPFPCEAEINFLKDVFSIQPFVEVFVTDAMPSGKAVYHFQRTLKDFV